MRRKNEKDKGKGELSGIRQMCVVSVCPARRQKKPRPLAIDTRPENEHMDTDIDATNRRCNIFPSLRGTNPAKPTLSLYRSDQRIFFARAPIAWAMMNAGHSRVSRVDLLSTGASSLVSNWALHG